jgi:transposase
MAYRYGNREQIAFFPPSIEQYVNEDDPVRVYDAFFDALNSSGLGLVLDDNQVGPPSYYPLTMLKILVYSYSYGWRSSRKIERALYHNLSFMWLAGGIKPDHKTISNFRKKHIPLLKETLKQCARMCLKLDLVEGNTLFVDGSKIRANAGKRQTRSKKTWEKYRGHIEKKIDELLEECEKIDAAEQESLVKKKKELKSKERLKNKIDGLIAEMEKEGLKKINGTDPSCKIMKGRQGSHAGYNCQIVSDEANGLIVSVEATTAMNDLNLLSGQIEKAEENLDKESQTNCADAGYSSVNDLVNLVDRSKRVVVPNNNQVKKSKKEEPFSKQAFSYNEEQDSYTCPEGKFLYRTRRKIIRGRIEYQIKDKNHCQRCKHFGKCTKSKTGRRIYRLKNEKTKEQLAAIYESEEGQRIYNKRKMLVEHQFGHIKHNLGANAFLLRGMDGVNAELSLFGTCFNIARMIRLLGGVRVAISKMYIIS